MTTTDHRILNGYRLAAITTAAALKLDRTETK